jgi:hypothetical protein
MGKQEKSLIVVENLFMEIGRLLGSDEESAERKKAAAAIFIAQSLRFMDEYFAEIKISRNLYRWLNKPLPDVPENTELKKAREKLERKEKRMCGKKYKEKFTSVWHKEWDVEKKYPQREFWQEEYNREMEKIWAMIRNAEQQEENDKARRISEATQEEINDLLGGILDPLKILVDTNDVNLKTLQYIIQTVAAEYFLEFIKRVCLILSVEVKKHGRWQEKSLALGKFLLSLKDRINKFSGRMDAKISVAFHDVISSAELFLVETNNWIIQKEQQERSQKQFIETLETGFQKSQSSLSW